MAETALGNRRLERVTVERISLCAELLPIRHAGSRINAICCGENERNGRATSKRIKGKVDTIRSWIVPAPIEAGVHVEAIARQAKVVGHPDVHSGGQAR